MIHELVKKIMPGQLRRDKDYLFFVISIVSGRCFCLIIPPTGESKSHYLQSFSAQMMIQFTTLVVA